MTDRPSRCIRQCRRRRSCPLPPTRSWRFRFAACAPVDGRLHVFERMFDSTEALGMTDEQIASRFETRGQTVHDVLLSLAIEVDHDVATEDDREGTRCRKRLD